ncbi:30S ribosomal protein S13 [Candidatus Uhrbacteria bacterium RIFCSPLOWO2_01_FULL_47_24]|uniref:Small ribosomal subunit protein uS13 n=1 Tax=Candidatus Uhrbacteria bacterium RIFCSPLOWO2_01_FULL_47_24 TaxID=1802401 RepID=A0A1F7UNS2_9BACT|nr:MAG: 30S ribosomal protein S13 [Candidatus Uhrbacteria bacterium RIFCSPHIGHO2_01_FULL_47_11]OGL68581.1 MAG: 30S ribosomal protein S13 [Candidatus Uhrbacteria bacterium RIFCSPHIGHO2_02_FULL_46_47]OGL79926.1 MAG: 30S ribosomal protein S13 [Candidatus Uhrbacteria bacterium RIFCSPLOWO2_01_FULL_47_24]OGL84787.1 MAG: 30S ribosomal protein S13 [Candidatus Uhrbacteria bacterium RIFCSPLOWO2_02_FULL_46_25]OGL93450.1 MAG: 30S ribosomal protein S13 [Candidatus Uhrbacteria bacterium RIFCSPLOWO2_12_FULL_4
MAIRIAGVVLPEKQLEVSLTYIYGIGVPLAKKILSQTKIDLRKKPKDLSEQEVAVLRETIEKQYRVEGELRRDVGSNIKRLKEIGTWRGMRHTRRLPIHGRTKTNSRTTRGNVRKTMGSGRKSAAEKT